MTGVKSTERGTKLQESSLEAKICTRPSKDLDMSTAKTKVSLKLLKKEDQLPIKKAKR